MQLKFRALFAFVGIIVLALLHFIWALIADAALDWTNTQIKKFWVGYELTPTVVDMAVQWGPPIVGALLITGLVIRITKPKIPPNIKPLADARKPTAMPAVQAQLRGMSPIDSDGAYRALEWSTPDFDDIGVFSQETKERMSFSESGRWVVGYRLRFRCWPDKDQSGKISILLVKNNNWKNKVFQDAKPISHSVDFNFNDEFELSRRDYLVVHYAVFSDKMYDKIRVSPESESCIWARKITS